MRHDVEHEWHVCQCAVEQPHGDYGAGDGIGEVLVDYRTDCSAVFVRFDTGYDDRDHVLLGVQLAEADLDCGAPDPEKLTLLSDEDCAKVAAEAKKLLDKADLLFDAKRMGYYLAGYVG